MNGTSNVIDFIFSHPNAGVCGVVSKMIASVDANGQTPMHIAARENVKIGYAAGRHGLDLALSSRDNLLGLTPLMIACSFNNFDSIRNLVELGASLHAVDESQHGCM